MRSSPDVRLYLQFGITINEVKAGAVRLRYNLFGPSNKQIISLTARIKIPGLGEEETNLRRPKRCPYWSYNRRFQFRSMCAKQDRKKASIDRLSYYIQRWDMQNLFFLSFCSHASCLHQQVLVLLLLYHVLHGTSNCTYPVFLYG